ncbi:hypothetical protein M9458_019678, partial [Cirrhinus mrigala]
ALNQGDAVDLDALMADLCSIEQELSTIGKPSSASSRLGLTGDAKVLTAPSTRAAVAAEGRAAVAAAPAAVPAPLLRLPRPPLASNFSLDDITAQLEKASLSMDEAARQSSTSFGSTVSAPYSSSTVRRPTSHHHHRRTGMSINSASASSMDSLDIEKPKSDQDGLQDGQDQPSSEVKNAFLSKKDIRPWVLTRVCSPIVGLQI